MILLIYPTDLMGFIYFCFVFIDQLIKSPRKSGTAPRWVSVSKAISWRVVGTMDTMIISWVVTGQLNLAMTIGLVELVTKFILYYLHERVWENARKHP